MYRMFQFFVLALKIDFFTGFMVSIFYLIQFAMKKGIMWETIVQVIVTVCMIPMLFFGRSAVSLLFIASLVFSYSFFIYREVQKVKPKWAFSLLSYVLCYSILY